MTCGRPADQPVIFRRRAAGGIGWGAFLWLLIASAASGIAPAAADTRLGSSVVVSQPIDDDLYAAAGEVEINNRVTGAAVVAAGSAELSGDVDGDMIVAAGRVNLRGGVGDDLRAAAGTIQISGFVTDQAIVAGGSVVLTRDGAIGGRSWIAGGNVEIDGQVGGDLKIAAGTAVIRGRIVGNVEVAARTIRVEPGTTILGELVWRSSQPPEIADDVRIADGVREAGEGEAPWPAEATGGHGTGSWAFGLALGIATLILLWSAPRLVADASAAFRAKPVGTLLLGAGAAILTPVVTLFLFATLLGWLLGIILLTGYLFALLLSGVLGVLILVQSIRRRLGLPEGGGWRTVLLLAATVMLVVVLHQVPFLGRLVSLLLVLAGLGALTALLTGRYPRRPPVP